MVNCVVKDCYNSSNKSNKTSKITFHGFPTLATLAAPWIDIIRLNRREDCWKPTKFTKICSSHFDENDKYTTKGGLCKIRQGALPIKGVYIGNSMECAGSNYNSFDPYALGMPCQPILKEESQTGGDGIHEPNVLETQQLITQDDSDDGSMFDTPQESVLRRKLEKMITIQLKHKKKIKVLKQQVRRLKKRNLSLENILKVKGLLAENMFTAEQYNRVDEKSTVVTEAFSAAVETEVKGLASSDADDNSGGSDSEKISKIKDIK